MDLSYVARGFLHMVPCIRSYDWLNAIAKSERPHGPRVLLVFLLSRPVMLAQCRLVRVAVSGQHLNSMSSGILICPAGLTLLSVPVVNLQVNTSFQPKPRPKEVQLKSWREYFPLGVGLPSNGRLKPQSPTFFSVQCLRRPCEYDKLSVGLGVDLA